VGHVRMTAIGIDEIDEFLRQLGSITSVAQLPKLR
jgi:hypothetical protein